MNEIASQLRETIAEIRRKPYPISDLIPMLARAAEEIEAADDVLALLKADSCAKQPQIDSPNRREIGKWLNEQPNRDIDRTALAALLFEYDRMAMGAKS